MNLQHLPALGQPLEGGTFAGITTTADGQHHAVVLLADKPDSTDHRLSWDAATAWAAGLSAQLPTRPMAAMLFANVKASFDGGWHWTSDVHPDDGSYAWTQHFDYGLQNNFRKSYEGRARAVRLIQLTA